MAVFIMHNSNDALIAANVPETGFFLEIGCWDGEHISQTAALERKGWQGVCVDPFPKNFHNRKCRVVSKAVTPYGGDFDFIKVSTDRRHGGDVSYFSGLADVIGKNETIKQIITDHCDYEIIRLQTISVADLFYPLPSVIDFLSLDVEGSELDIMAALPYSDYDIRCIMVEHNMVPDVQLRMISMMSQNGYVLSGHTDIDYLFKKKI